MKNARPKIPFLTVLLIVAVLIGGIYFAGRSGSDPKAYGNDFNVYYFAAREVIEGRTPYENSLGEWTPYLYLPLLAELLVPFAWLPLPVAAYLWFLWSAFSVFIAARMSASMVADSSDETRRNLLIALSLIVLARFILDNFDYGQVNTVVTGLTVAHLYFYAKHKRLASAIALALAAAIKLTPLLFILYHLARRRVKFAIACTLLFIGVSALSFAPLGSRADDAFNTFFKRTIQNEQGFDFAYHGNQSLRAAIERFSGNQEVTSPSSPVTTAISLMLLVLACFVAMRTPSEIAASAAFFCLTVLLSSLSWKQHFVMLILPIAFLLGDALREPRKKYAVILTLVVVFALFNLTSPKVTGVAAAEWGDAHSLVFAGALMIYAACIKWGLQNSRPSTRHTQKLTVADKP